MPSLFSGKEAQIFCRFWDHDGHGILPGIISRSAPKSPESHIEYAESDLRLFSGRRRHSQECVTGCLPCQHPLVIDHSYGFIRALPCERAGRSERPVAVSGSL